MDDTIEICSGCGKMPRAIDRIGGTFICSRCGNRTTMHVSADNYESVVTELDQRFHAMIQKARIEAAASAPIEARKPKKAPAKAKKKQKPRGRPAPKKAASKKRRK